MKKIITNFTKKQRQEYIEKYCDVVKSDNKAYLINPGEDCFEVLSKNTHKYIESGTSLDKIISYEENTTLDFLIAYDITYVDSTFKTSNVANIGFSPKNNKWYGWSHRGWCDFTIGSKVKMGDCAYVATSKEDYEKQQINFWCGSKEDGMLNPHIINRTDKTFTIEATYSTDPKIIPNKTIRGKVWTYTCHYPDKILGHGEWIAKTMEDARQMACDYAESVA